MSPPDASQRWLTLGRKDLKAAFLLAHAMEPQLDIAGFHLQQAAEKFLKAWLATFNALCPHTHDLSLLLGLIEEEGEDVTRFWPLLELNPFAVQFRYELPCEEFPDFETFAQLTQQLLTHVESLLGEQSG